MGVRSGECGRCSRQSGVRERGAGSGQSRVGFVSTPSRQHIKFDSVCSTLLSNCPASFTEGVRVRQRLPATCYCIRSLRSDNSIATVAALTISYLPSDTPACLSTRSRLQNYMRM